MSQELPPPGGFGQHNFSRTGRARPPKLSPAVLWGVTLGMMGYGLFQYTRKMRRVRDIKIARVHEREEIIEDMDKFRAYRMYHNDITNNQDWVAKVEKLKASVEASTAAHVAYKG